MLVSYPDPNVRKHYRFRNHRYVHLGLGTRLGLCNVTIRQVYGGPAPVGRGCHDVHIRDLRTCTHAHLGFADLHILDLRTCTHAHLAFADLHIRDLRKCNCFHVVATWKQLHFRKSRMCKSANRVCARHDSRDLVQVQPPFHIPFKTTQRRPQHLPRGGAKHTRGA